MTIVTRSQQVAEDAARITLVQTFAEVKWLDKSMRMLVFREWDPHRYREAMMLDRLKKIHGRRAERDLIQLAGWCGLWPHAEFEADALKAACLTIEHSEQASFLLGHVWTRASMWGKLP